MDRLALARTPLSSAPTVGTIGEVLTIDAPARQRVALVFASPHSGRAYPPDFVAASALDPVSLRRSEDAQCEPEGQREVFGFHER